jgi:hypothetical protein
MYFREGALIPCRRGEGIEVEGRGRKRLWLARMMFMMFVLNWYLHKGKANGYLSCELARERDFTEFSFQSSSGVDETN